MEPHAILNEVWSTSKDTVSRFIIRFTELVTINFPLNNPQQASGSVLKHLSKIKVNDDQKRYYF